MLPSVDCHFHVIGPQARFPMLAGRSYTPPEASLLDWKAALEPLGITQGVVVQPSVYGTDNRALLATLVEGSGRLVGVAAASAGISDEDLDALAAAGVRGLRFSHFTPGDPRAMAGFVPLCELPALAPRLRRRELHVDLFTDTRLLGEIAPMLRDARLTVVLDHMGRTPAALGIRHAGMSQLRALLDEGWCWVKLSGLANISNQAPVYDDVREIHDLLVGKHADRLVWGSDWPHTRSHGAGPTTRHLFEAFAAWTPQLSVRRSILAENPRQLYRLA
jgi:2-pyrone-4,6-dicarboxylate lactonase